VMTADPSFQATNISGELPPGLSFDVKTGRVSGTPESSGIFRFTIRATASNAVTLTKTYAFAIADAGEVLPPHCSVDTSASPTDEGTTSGTDVYMLGTTATVEATPKPGFAFVNWSENGTVVSTASSYTFTNSFNRSLVANFVAAPPLPQLSSPTVQGNALVFTWPTNFTGYVVEESPDLGTPNWVTSGSQGKAVGAVYQVTVSPLTGTRFFRLRHP
jgi:hypothetical protein